METSELFRIETARLILRDYQEEDYEAVHAFRSNPLVARYRAGRPDTPDDTRAFLRRARESALLRPRTQYRLAVILRETGAVIGGCALNGTPDPAAREGGIGFSLSRPCWGSGYATEAATALAAFGFETLKSAPGLRRLCARKWGLGTGDAEDRDAPGRPPARELLDRGRLAGQPAVRNPRP